ncbi:MAG TPA: hypothetical protein PKW35_22280, partial [Nannocystaceae bacterium]|nr:hypothetical protein [Nannocystaceae bacterium]
MAPLAPAHDRSRSTPTPRRPVADDHERIVPTLRPIDSRPPGPRPHRATTLTLTILSLGALAASSHLARADPPPPTSPPLTATASNTAPASRLDLKAEADRRFRAGELADAAALWAQLGAPLEPGSDRHLLIWKALGAWERAFAADHDHRHLCAARDLALAVLRDHLRQDHRLE